MKVKEIMTAAPTTCTPDATLAEAANLMWETDCGVLPVVDDGELMGIVTDRDMFIALGTRNTRAAHLRVGAAATTKVSTCGPADEIQAALATMKEARVRRLPVVDTNGKLIGILSLNDIALAAGDNEPVPALENDDDRQRLTAACPECAGLGAEHRGRGHWRLRRERRGHATW